MNKTAQNIITAAERMIWDAGYHSFSFRKIANELSIKDASIHYHFTAKEDLDLAVTKGYTEVFLNAFGNSESKKTITFYIKAFEGSLKIG